MNKYSIKDVEAWSSFVELPPTNTGEWENTVKSYVMEGTVGKPPQTTEYNCMIYLAKMW